MRRRSSSMRSSVRATSMPAALGEDAHLLVLADAVDRQRGHLLRVVDQVDEVRGVACGPARVGQRALVEQHDVAPAQAAEVVGEAVADDAGADHDGSQLSSSLRDRGRRRRSRDRGAVRGVRRARPARRGAEPALRSRRRERPDHGDDHRLLRHPARPAGPTSSSIPTTTCSTSASASATTASWTSGHRHKEVVVTGEPSGLLWRRSTTRAITRLVVEDGEAGDRPSDPGRSPARAPASSPAWRTRRRAGWPMATCASGATPVTEGYVDPKARLREGNEEPSRAVRLLLAAELGGGLEDGVPVETYRRIEPRRGAGGWG